MRCSSALSARSRRRDIRNTGGVWLTGEIIDGVLSTEETVLFSTPTRSNRPGDPKSPPGPRRIRLFSPSPMSVSWLTISMCKVNGYRWPIERNMPESPEQLRSESPLAAGDWRLPLERTRRNLHPFYINVSDRRERLPRLCRSAESKAAGQGTGSPGKVLEGSR